jgi:hypothetical protein
MGTVYWKADQQVNDLIATVIHKYHSELGKANVRIGTLMSFNEKAPPVKHGGYQAYATVRIISLKDRVTKDHDVEMCIDAEAWKQFTSMQKEALIDHELSHIKCKKKKARGPDGKPIETDELMFDDLSRPLLKLIKADWNVGDGFADVVSRHKESSVEYVSINKAKELADAASA